MSSKVIDALYVRKTLAVRPGMSSLRCALSLLVSSKSKRSSPSPFFSPLLFLADNYLKTLKVPALNQELMERNFTGYPHTSLKISNGLIDRQLNFHCIEIPNGIFTQEVKLFEMKINNIIFFPMKE